MGWCSLSLKAGKVDEITILAGGGLNHPSAGELCVRTQRLCGRRLRNRSASHPGNGSVPTFYNGPRRSGRPRPCPEGLRPDGEGRRPLLPDFRALQAVGNWRSPLRRPLNFHLGAASACQPTIAEGRAERSCRIRNDPVGAEAARRGFPRWRFPWPCRPAPRPLGTPMRRRRARPIAPSSKSGPLAPARNSTFPWIKTRPASVQSPSSNGAGSRPTPTPASRRRRSVQQRLSSASPSRGVQPTFVLLSHQVFRVSTRRS